MHSNTQEQRYIIKVFPFSHLWGVNVDSNKISKNRRVTKRATERAVIGISVTFKENKGGFSPWITNDSHKRNRKSRDTIKEYQV